jgi:hypothetical protein
VSTVREIARSGRPRETETDAGNLEELYPLAGGGILEEKSRLGQEKDVLRG